MQQTRGTDLLLQAAAADGQKLEGEVFVLDSALATTKHSLKLLNLLMTICFRILFNNYHVYVEYLIANDN